LDNDEEVFNYVLLGVVM